MKNIKTVFYLGTNAQGLYDATLSGISVNASSKVGDAGDERMLKINKGGFVRIGRNKALDSLDSFTLEAFVFPTQTGKRMNIMESQVPSAALFIDSKRRLVGSIHISSGWKSLDSGAHKLSANKHYHVRFSRDEKGNMQLDLNGKKVALKKITGKIKNVGTKGFIVGTGMDGRSFQFSGNIGDVKIMKGAVTSGSLNLMKKQALQLESKIKAKFKLSRVLVEFEPDISYARLQPVKNILNAAGVENLSDLSTLQIKTRTVMTPGKVLIAPKKIKANIVVNWLALARIIGTTDKNKKKKLIAKHLTNRNSHILLKRALPSTGHSSPSPMTMGTVSSTSPLSPIGLSAFSVASASGPQRFRLATGRPVLSDMIKLEDTALKIIDSAILEKLENKNPENWPAISGQSPILLSMTSIPVGTAVIIAGTFDLSNTELVIEPEVETLYIIAEKIICGNNAKITWRRPGGSTPARADNPDLNGRGYAGVHQKSGSYDGIDGEDGRPGTSGTPGAKGLSAPNLEIWVKDMNAMPDLDLNGEDGIKGGRGQRGGRGGSGADGRVGKRAWFFGWHCTKDPGDGGDGGDGGNGGRGGRGGRGGKGGNITIGVLEDTLTSTVTNKSFKIKDQGGQKGLSGTGGPGGNGGNGGWSGVGETCKDAKNGHKGAKGQPGSAGNPGTSVGNDGLVSFFEFTEEAWDDLLTRPWILELDPEYVFPGSSLRIKGTRFTHHDRVFVGPHQLVPGINADESLTVTIPNSISGGEKIVFIRRQDGSESNRLKLWVKPQLDIFTGALNPGATVSLKGRAFVTGASAIIDGQSVTATVSNSNNLSFTVPGTGGAGSSERTVSLQVRNPDGMMSNIRMTFVPDILEIPFRFGVHDFSFDNFKSGSPSWSTYLDTFGAAEVWHEQLDPLFGHPILTAAFYAFYHYFLKGEANGGLATGFCTSLSAVVLDEFWTGSTDTHTRYALNSANRKKFTAIHGRLLSRESLIHFHDQGRQGNARVLQTYREIEHAFFNGCDRYNAPMLFFIPSGSIWDSGYVDKLGSTHCIVPVRFVYPKGHGGPKADGTTDPDGVTLYCWDCNHPPELDTSDNESENCRLVFRRTAGEIRFDYFDGTNTTKFFSEDGITLGMMSNGKYHLSDHDLPFSGPLGLTRFVLDFLLSPADLQVTDGDGFRTGLFGNQIISEIPSSRPVYLARGAYMLPENTPLTRRITGSGNGKYTFNSITPDGTSIALENVSTHIGEEDVLAVNADGTQLRFTPGANKNFTLTLARHVDDQLRGIAVEGIGGGPADDIDITLSPELTLCRIGNRSSLKTVKVRAFSINSETQAHSTIDRSGIKVPKDHDLVLGITDWVNLDLNVDALPFE